MKMKATLQVSTESEREGGRYEDDLLSNSAFLHGRRPHRQMHAGHGCTKFEVGAEGFDMMLAQHTKKQACMHMPMPGEPLIISCSRLMNCVLCR